MAGERPSFAEHLVLMEHDRAHGEAEPKLGARGHWLRTWLFQRCRQWNEADTVVCGANPVLGALASAAIARAGGQVIWAREARFDAWDYPLAVGGEHDDLLREAGLPPMGPQLFAKLAEESAGRIVVARGWSVSYVFEAPPASVKIGFASPEVENSAGNMGAARRVVEGWAHDAFASAPRLAVSTKPQRHGGAARQQLFCADRFVWTSDRLDGQKRQQLSEPQDAGRPWEERLGRARWHTQAPLAFAVRSREDIQLALAMRKTR